MSVMSTVGIFIAFIVVVILFAILFRVMLMLAVNEDCKAIGVKNRTMWTVLSFFFPIAAIVYVCIRKNIEKEVPKYCPSCGASSPPGSIACLNCGNPGIVDYQVNDAELHKSKRKTFVIIMIIAYAVYLITYVTGIAVYTYNLTRFAVDGIEDSFGYYEDYGDYGYPEDDFDEDGIDDFFDEYDEDIDDFFEEFDNFG